MNESTFDAFGFFWLARVAGRAARFGSDEAAKIIRLPLKPFGRRHSRWAGGAYRPREGGGGRREVGKVERIDDAERLRSRSIVMGMKASGPPHASPLRPLRVVGCGEIIVHRDVGGEVVAGGAVGVEEAARWLPRVHEDGPLREGVVVLDNVLEIRMLLGAEVGNAHDGRRGGRLHAVVAHRVDGADRIVRIRPGGRLVVVRGRAPRASDPTARKI